MWSCPRARRYSVAFAILPSEMLTRFSNDPPSGPPASAGGPGSNFNDRPVVLLVDDQAIIVAAVRHQLASQADIEFHFCSDPAVAVETAARLGPSVILQDLVMP